MALATIADVEARLGRSLTVKESQKALAYLNDASALFIQRAVQKFEPGESTVRLIPKDGIARLVQRPVISITDVTDLDGNTIDYTWDGHQSIYDLDGYTAVTVTYEHGSYDIPAEVVAVVAGMVARTLSISPDAAAGVQSQTVGPFSQQYATWAVGAQVMMSPAEAKVADAFRGLTFRSTSTMGNGTYHGSSYQNQTRFDRH